MSFCTVVNCMDGRIQLPVIAWMKERFGARWVDTVTEAGPVRILAGGRESAAAASILGRVDVSVEKHGSRAVAIVAHHDCAGNPASEEEQRDQLRSAVAFLEKRYPGKEILGLWVDRTWSVTLHCTAGPPE